MLMPLMLMPWLEVRSCSITLRNHQTAQLHINISELGDLWLEGTRRKRGQPSSCGNNERCFKARVKRFLMEKK